MTEEQRKDVTNNVLYKACNTLMVTMQNHDLQLEKFCEGQIMQGNYMQDYDYESKYLRLLNALSIGIRKIKMEAGK